MWCYSKFEQRVLKNISIGCGESINYRKIRKFLDGANLAQCWAEDAHITRLVMLIYIYWKRTEKINSVCYSISHQYDDETM